jgi:hypothetical protein
MIGRSYGLFLKRSSALEILMRIRPTRIKRRLSPSGWASPLARLYFRTTARSWGPITSKPIKTDRATTCATVGTWCRPMPAVWAFHGKCVTTLKTLPLPWASRQCNSTSSPPVMTLQSPSGKNLASMLSGPCRAPSTIRHWDWLTPLSCINGSLTRKPDRAQKRSTQ